ncbi:MAG TPA: hypothetical protein VFN22_12635 [Gemmatimonadales bacterium]|nr:hypothetical protein [Gemmatimonadales bacterium]
MCRHCAKWNLVPFDTRLESIDACERLFRDTRTRFSTDNIGLAKVGDGLELVRVGVALRPEFASWRYGAQYRRRRRKAMLAGGAGVAAVGGLLAISSGAGMAVGSMGSLTYLALKKGWEYGVNRMASLTIEHPFTARPVRLGMKHLQHAILSWEDDVPAFELPLYSTQFPDKVRWTGNEYSQYGRKALGNLNLLTGKQDELAYATEALAEHRGDLGPWLKWRTQQAEKFGAMKLKNGEREPRGWGTGYTQPFLRVNRLPAGERLAVEMWMNEDIERTWLEGELKLLEREWRDAERLAKIADDLELEPEQVV